MSSLLLTSISIVFSFYPTDPRVLTATPESSYGTALKICGEVSYTAENLQVLEACAYIFYPYLEDIPTPSPVPPTKVSE